MKFSDLTTSIKKEEDLDSKQCIADFFNFIRYELIYSLAYEESIGDGFFPAMSEIIRQYQKQNNLPVYQYNFYIPIKIKEYFFKFFKDEKKNTVYCIVLNESEDKCCLYSFCCGRNYYVQKETKNTYLSLYAQFFRGWSERVGVLVYDESFPSINQEICRE